MDINVEVRKNELELKESSVIKTENEYKDISKLEIKTENVCIKENQNGNSPATFIKKEPDDDNIEKLKEEFNLSEEDGTLYEIKTEDLMLKRESESDNSKTGFNPNLAKIFNFEAFEGWRKECREAKARVEKLKTKHQRYKNEMAEKKEWIRQLQAEVETLLEKIVAGDEEISDITEHISNIEENMKEVREFFLS